MEMTLSKLSDFLEKQKIDPRRVLVASKQVEAFRPEDRAIQLAKKRVKGGKPTDAEKETAAKKSRSGRAVTKPLLGRALAGETLTAKARGRVLRAVNHILTQKKADVVTAADLF